MKIKSGKIFRYTNVMFDCRWAIRLLNVCNFRRPMVFVNISFQLAQINYHLIPTFRLPQPHLVAFTEGCGEKRLRNQLFCKQERGQDETLKPAIRRGADLSSVLTTFAFVGKFSRNVGGLLGMLLVVELGFQESFGKQSNRNLSKGSHALPSQIIIKYRKLASAMKLQLECHAQRFDFFQKTFIFHQEIDHLFLAKFEGS